MLTSKRERVFFISSLILIGIGWYYLVFVGVPKVMDSTKTESASNPIEKFQCGGGVMCSSAIYITNFQLNGVRGTAYSHINFTTSKVFAVFNRINYTIDVTTEPENSIKDIDFFLLGAIENKTKVMSMSTNKLIEVGKVTGHLLESHKTSSTTFYGSGWWNPVHQDTFWVFGIITLSNGKSYVGQLTDQPVFMTDSHLAKLQADTNSEIIKQVRESESSNLLIEGLSWIGISIIPLILGGEILLRLFLDPYLVHDHNDN